MKDNRITVYLAGAIHGRTDAQAMDWRQWVASRLTPEGFCVLDPMRRDYRGVEEANEDAIYTGDLIDILQSHVLVVNAATPSWGTAMELVYATQFGKHIIAVGERLTSPWLKRHTAVRVETMAEAVEMVHAFRAR